MINIFKPEIPNFGLIELENVCRICLHSERNMVSLFDNEIDSLISEFLPGKLNQKPSQPHQICFKCLHKARTAYMFKKQCEYADGLINSILNEPNISQTYEKQTQTDVSAFIYYECEKCKKQFSSLEILKEHHLNDHRKATNICRICGKVFSHSFTLRNHLTSVHRELGFLDNHRCCLCEKIFTKKLLLKSHLLNVHNVNEYFETENEINLTIEEDTIFVEIGKNEFSCENCLENFEVEDDLKNHECTTFLYKKVFDKNPSNWLQLINNCDKNEMENVSDSEENIECDFAFADNLKTEYDDEHEEYTVEKKEQIFDAENEINTENLFAEELKVSQEIFGDEITEPREKITRETDPKKIDCIVSSKSLTTRDHKFFKQKMDPKYMNLKIICSTDKKNCKKRSFSCKICMKKFISENSVRNHIAIIHNRSKEFSCKYCLEKVIGETEYKKHCKEDCTKIAHTKRHLCSECGTRFRQLHQLRRHIRKHTGEKPYKCEYCDRAFSAPTNLYRHRKIHTGEKTYHCTICPKSFIQSTSLRTHMRTHTGERPFKCIQCPRTFKDNPALRQHNRSHTGERCFCDLCGLGYRSSISLLNHKRGVHGIDKTKEFSCKICSEKIIGALEYKKHCKLHVPKEKLQKKTHICSECGTCFKDTNQLKLHMRTHTGEKPFKCEYCDKAFAAPANLYRHRKIHTGEKNYHCTVCSKSFSQSNSLKSHMRIHTGERPYKCSYCPMAFTENRTLQKHLGKHTRDVI